MTHLVWMLALVAMGRAEVVQSPGQAVRLDVNVADGRLVYGVSFRGKEVIRPSALGLGLEGAARLDSHFRVARTDHASHRLNWKPPYGERAEIPDHYQGLTLELEETIVPRRRLIVEFRAYDEGVAFRYRLSAQAPATVGDEVTEFRLAPGASAWETPGAQREYRRVAVDKMSGASERPLLLELPNGLWAALGEAGVEDYRTCIWRRCEAKGTRWVCRCWGRGGCREAAQVRGGWCWWARGPATCWNTTTFLRI